MTANRMVTAPHDHENRADPRAWGQLEEIQGDAGQEVDPEQLVDAGRENGHERQRRVDGGIRIQL